MTKITIPLEDAYDDPNSFNYNEDYYRQIEFLPIENFNNVEKTGQEIAEFAKNNFDEYGWWGSYVRNEVDFPTRNRNIPITEIEIIFLERKYFEFKRVTESQSTIATVQQNTKAFKNNSIVICFNYKDNILENLWLNYAPRSEDFPEYKEILIILSKRYSFLLADWWKSIIVDTSSSNEIDAYFKIE